MAMLVYQRVGFIVICPGHVGCFSLDRKLDLFKVFFSLCTVYTIVNHHQTNSWDNSVYLFQAFYANPRERTNTPPKKDKVVYRYFLLMKLF